MSITKHLLILVLTVSSLFWLFVAAQAYVHTQHEISEVFDANLAQNARALYSLLKHKIDSNEHLEIDLPLIGHRYQQKIAFLVRAHDGDLIAHSPNSPIFPMPTLDSPLYQNHQTKQHLWRVFTLKTDKSVIQVAEQYYIRQELIQEITWGVAVVFIMGLPILAILMAMVIHRSLRPLRCLVSEITQRTPEQLNPIQVESIPPEISTVVNALNQLLQRLAYTLNNERRFTSDASHELRTPLSALKVQAQVALRAETVTDKDIALREVVKGVDRATHLVTQLLILARMDASQAMKKQTVDLKQVIYQVISDLSSAALNKQIDLGVEITTESTTIQSNTEALYTLLRNLVDNAILYTPEQGRVTIFLNQAAGKMCLLVQDSGIGISIEQQQQVFERFYRGGHDKQGSGLGLSIVKRIVDLHDAHIQFEPVTQGCCIMVIFPVF
ncbi:ATP-binding protein [Candidatus Albibeggiatoa sp. nov. BB20]|uniref:ATP-binding protein n=1 Tax=Candidatus Albibeggiatoa sp. nov. BB20 TaxID=3162723 RepID=UPI0033655BA7